MLFIASSFCLVAALGWAAVTGRSSNPSPIGHFFQNFFLTIGADPMLCQVSVAALLGADHPVHTTL
jgi:hypothetical protein